MEFSYLSTWVILKPEDPQEIQKLMCRYLTTREILQVSFLSKEEAQIGGKNA